MASGKPQSQQVEGEAQQGSPTLNETRPLALKFGCPLESSGAFGNAHAQVTPQRSDFIGLGPILGTEIFKPFPGGGGRPGAAGVGNPLKQMPSDPKAMLLTWVNILDMMSGQGRVCFMKC